MEDLAIWGTVVNAATVILGSLVGLGIMAIGKRKKVPAEKTETSSDTGRGKLSDFVFRGMGLCVLWIGLAGALEGVMHSSIVASVSSAETVVQGGETLIVVLSMAIGAVIGHLCNLEGLLDRFGKFVEKSLGKRFGNVSEGFVTASLLFCVGAMAVNGAIACGMNHDPSIYYAKSLIDGISAAVFASTMGVGVMLSAVAVFVYQGTLTLLAALGGSFLSEAVKLEMSVVGSLLIAALGLNMLGTTKIKVMNYLPAMFLPIGLCPLWDVLLSRFV